MKLYALLCLVLLLAFANALPLRAAPNAETPQSGQQVDNAGSKPVTIAPVSNVKFKQDGIITAGLLVKLLTGLFFSIVLIVGAVYLLKKYYFGIGNNTASTGQDIKIMEVKRVTPKSTLVYVEFRGKHILLAQTGEQLTVVDKDLSTD